MDHPKKRLKSKCFLRLAAMIAFVLIARAGSGQSDPSLGFLCPSFSYNERGHLKTSYIGELPDRMVYLKIDQGFSMGRLLDQRMSNLHYTGPGGVLAFGRHVRTDRYINQWTFAGFRFQQAQPRHKGTQVIQPVGGLGFSHLRPFRQFGPFPVWVGLQTDLLANVRVAPSLGNSFLYADLTAEFQPLARLSAVPHLFGRDWHFDLSLSAGLIGYALRLPEYGSSFQLGSDGGVTLLTTESMMLHPGNYARLTGGLFFKDSFGGRYNPNWFRIGYIWDYYRIHGRHGLSMFDASHQFVLELYFLMN